MSELAATDAAVQRTSLERSVKEALVAAESATGQQLQQATAGDGFGLSPRLE